MAVIGYTETNKQRGKLLSSFSAPLREEPQGEINKVPAIRANLQMLAEVIEYLDQAAVDLAGRLEGVCEPVASPAADELVSVGTGVPVADELAAACHRIASITQFMKSVRDRVAL